MTATTKDRNTLEATGPVQDFAVKASTVILSGIIACLDASGLLVQGSTATGLTCVGRSDEQVDNSDGSNGDLRARVRSGVFLFENSASSDEITDAEIGDDCYIVDNQTVAKTDGSSSRSLAGKIVQVEARGVWVKMGLL